MPAFLTKFLRYLVLSLQMVLITAPAQGLILCVPTDGVAHLETRSQQQSCPRSSAPEAINDYSITDAAKACHDLPVIGQGDAVKPTQQVTAQFDVSQFVSALPPFLQVTLAPTVFATTPRAVADGDVMPDATLTSLGSVILVI